MEQFTKSFIDGEVQSYDGRIYRILLPDGEIAILRYSTVHKMCTYPESMMEGDHLKSGATIHLCKIIKPDKISILPDHRHYISETKANSDSEEFMSLLSKASMESKLTDAVKESVRLFALGFVPAASILLATALKITKNNKK